MPGPDGPYTEGWPRPVGQSVYDPTVNIDMPVVPFADAERLRESLEAIATGNIFTTGDLQEDYEGFARAALNPETRG